MKYFEIADSRELIMSDTDIRNAQQNMVTGGITVNLFSFYDL